MQSRDNTNGPCPTNDANVMIFLSGGGTMGSVSPLLALTQELRRARPGTRFVWIGTRNGPEQKLVPSAGIAFRPIFSGKWRRYVSLKNLSDTLLIVLGFFQNLYLILKYKPSVIVAAGAFVSVPLVWAGWVCRVPSIIHQQDIQVGLANKLMQPFAKKITVTFQEQLKLFPAKKVVWTGNPVREEILKGDRMKAMELFQLEEGIPTVLVTGGGTGAEFLNNLIDDSLPHLVKFCQIIHLRGGRGISHKNKTAEAERAWSPAVGGTSEVEPLRPASTRGEPSLVVRGDIPSTPRYRSFPFLTAEMPHALAVADLVICRAGMGTLSELAALGKPAIVIPMPGTHQEENAAFFKAHGAVEVMHQNGLTSEIFVATIRELLTHLPLQQQLSGNIKRLMPAFAVVRMAEVVAACVAQKR